MKKPPASSAPMIRVSEKLQEVASALDGVLEEIAGQRVAFSLFVWTEERANYISNGDRQQIITVLEKMIAQWKAGMPDIPAHEIRG